MMKQTKKKKSEQDLTRLVERIFCFSFIWSFGGGIISGHDKFSNYMCGDAFDNCKIGLKGDVFSSFVDMKTGDWVLWNTIVSDFKFNPGFFFFLLFYPVFFYCSTRYFFFWIIQNEKEKEKLI